MTYKHLTTRELSLIADFWYQGTKAYRAAKLLQRSLETIYRVYRFLNDCKTIDQYLQTYQRHKRRCGFGWFQEKLKITFSFWTLRRLV